MEPQHPIFKAPTRVDMIAVYEDMNAFKAGNPYWDGPQTMIQADTLAAFHEQYRMCVTVRYAITLQEWEQRRDLGAETDDDDPVHPGKKPKPSAEDIAFNESTTTMVAHMIRKHGLPVGKHSSPVTINDWEIRFLLPSQRPLVERDKPWALRQTGRPAKYVKTLQEAVDYAYSDL